MKNHYISFVFLISVSDPTVSAAQVREEWVVRYNGPDNKEDGPRAMAVDVRGYVYVTGWSLGTSWYSATIKYDPQGNVVWVARYNGPTEAIAVDPKGNVYVTGQAGEAPREDFLTIKYDSAGNEVWVARYNTGYSRGIGDALALDAEGNIHITGPGATIKYDPDGNLIWAARSGGEAIVLDNRGNVYVTDNSDLDYRTVKLDSQGNVIWTARYNGPANLADFPSALALDAAGNVYVTGSSAVTQSRWGTVNDYVTIKYDADGNQQWVSRYNGPYGDDNAKAIAVDPGGNVYVTGMSRQGPTDTAYATIKYDQNGNEVWVAKYNGAAIALALDGQGNIYVTGSSARDANRSDAVTVKYDPNGNAVWVAGYNGPSTGAVAVVVDVVGNVYVTGGSPHDEWNNYNLDFATIKYSQSQGSSFVRKLYFPRLVTDAGESTGIAIVNLDTEAASLRFTAYDETGSVINGSEITNPADRTLGAGSQIPVMDAEVFGDGLMSSGAVGWLQVESTVAKIAGFFLSLDPSLTFLDGGDVSSRSTTSFVFPEIDTGTDAFTQVHIANPNGSSTETSLELIGVDGIVRAKTEQTIQPNGVLAVSLPELFAGVTLLSSDYLRVTASQGVAPFELMGRTGRHVRGLNGQDTAYGATTLYSPQYVSGGSTWGTTLSVVNLHQTSGTVAFRFIGDDGSLIATRERTIAPRGKLLITERDFFVSPATQRQGYVEIRSSGPQLAGSVAFGDQDRSKFATALPLVTHLRSDMIFSQVASAEGSAPSWFTGLALLNPGPADTNAKVEVFDQDGNVVKSGNFIVPAERRVVQLLTQYFPDLVGRDILKGYIHVTADQPLASFAVFGTTSLSVLSAIPPQAVP